MHYKENTRYRIKTPLGYKDFSGVVSKTTDTLIRFDFDDTFIRVSPKHVFLTDSGFSFAKDLSIGQTITGKKISKITLLTEGPYIVYDPVGVEESETYYSNDVVSHNTEFLGSSNTLIDGNKLAQLTYIDPILTNNDVDMYEDVNESRVYATVVDTSRGSGIDYSAFIVFDITDVPYRVVAKYRNNEIESLVYPTIIYNVSRHYNDAYVLVEINDVGQQVVDILQHDLEYENVLSTKTKGRAGQKIGGTMGGVRFAMGVRTTTQVKRIGCANFKSLVENDKLIINDYDLLQEMYRFVEHNAKYQAEEGSHDDLVMCCVLFSWLVHQDYFKELSNNDARLEVLANNQRLIEENLVPFGYVDEAWEDPNAGDDFESSFRQWLMM